MNYVHSAKAVLLVIAVPMDRSGRCAAFGGEW